MTDWLNQERKGNWQCTIFHNPTRNPANASSAKVAAFMDGALASMAKWRIAAPAFRAVEPASNRQPRSSGTAPITDTRSPRSSAPIFTAIPQRTRKIDGTNNIDNPITSLLCPAAETLTGLKALEAPQSRDAREGKTHMLIKTISDFRKAVRNGPYAWPGGYPLYWIMADGEACAFKVAQRGSQERRAMLEALRDDSADDWRPIALEVNYEDDDLWCAHRGEKIESAYA